MKSELKKSLGTGGHPERTEPFLVLTEILLPVILLLGSDHLILIKRKPLFCFLVFLKMDGEKW